MTFEHLNPHMALNLSTCEELAIFTNTAIYFS